MLRGGQALTPFVLYALLQVPPEQCDPPEGAVERALAFIRTHVDDQGALGNADPDILEYPNYATAFALRCLQQAGGPGDEPLKDKMRSYLLAEQFTQARGFEPEHPAYGGWGFGGKHGPGETGHSDLAHVRYALEALQHARPPAETLERAVFYLKMLQKHPGDRRPQPLPPEEAHAGAASGYDGGFYFSPVVLLANKGRLAYDDQQRPYWRSYATATCDGLLALLACGVEPDDERVAAAVAWLQRHPRLDYPEGIPTEHPEPWGDAVAYYHFAVRAEAYARLDWPGPWREELRKLLAERQDPDGSFINRESPLMKEDDPLMCTALAVIALSQ